MNSVTFKKKSINKESLGNYIKLLESKKKSIIFDSEMANETAKEASIHTPYAQALRGNNSILWEDVNQTIEENQHLDEDDIQDLKHKIEVQKRNAIVNELITSSHNQHDAENTFTLDLPPDSNRPIDILVENTNARKNFMLICKQSDKFIESEEFKNSHEFHYFKT